MSAVREADVVEALRSFADNPSAYLALNAGTKAFSVPGLDGMIAYRSAGRYLIQFGGPFAPEPDARLLLDAFLAVAAAEHRRVVAVQLQEHDLPTYARRGFVLNQVGASYALELDRFTLAGSGFVSLRNKISRARRLGLVVDQAVADDRGALDAVDRSWLGGKGAKAMEFLVGERSERGAAGRRILVGRLEHRVVGYLSYVPAYGRRPGWLYDLSRRVADAPPGVMEAINAAGIALLRAEGAGWLHFGFTPFAGLDPALEHPTASPAVGRAMRFLAANGERVYPTRTQLAYKQKWGPHAVLPEYIGFQGGPRPSAILRLLRLTQAL